MSSYLFPVTYPGKLFNYIRSYLWNTGLQKAVSGKTSTIAYQPYPLGHWEYSFEFLREYVSPSEIKGLVGLFNAVQGRFDTFLLSDPDFNTVTLQQFATCDSETNAFQLIAVYENAGGPGQAEIVQNLNGTPAIYGNGGNSTVPLPAAGLNAPGSAPTLSYTPGGSLPATTYYVHTANFDAAENFSAPSPQGSIAVPANNLLVVGSPIGQPGAAGWGAFVGTVTGTGTWQNAAGDWQIGTSWTEPTTGIITGGKSLPTTNQTGYSIGPTGIVTLVRAPDAGIILSWSGSFYYRCRFDADHYDWTRLMNGFWSAQKITFTQVIL